MRWLESPDLSAVLIAFFAMLGTVMGGGTITQLLGRKKTATEKPPEFAEVKGAIVSSKDIDRMVLSLDAFTAAAIGMTHSINTDVEAKKALTKSLTALIEAHGGNLDTIRANTAAANAVATEAHDLRASIDDLSKELEFQSRMKGRRDE